MQHRIRIGSHFYSVTVVGEEENSWVAMAEVAGGWLVRTGTTQKSALDQWQAAAHAMQRPAERPSASRPRAGSPRGAKAGPR
ncbi:MAG TPA: hypothetical protein VH722_19100 [Alphaproteobacteria bacterium]|jgi:hypothetical protein|nr:hypothetical protein [Alphaproteobacteria bacterium]